MAAFPRRTELPSPESPTINNELAASQQKLPSLFDPKYWKSVCPDLHIRGSAKGIPPIALPQSVLQDLKDQLTADGVIQVASKQLPMKLDMLSMCQSVVSLLQHGWPAPFLVLFDEIWQMIQRMSDVMMATTGNQCNMDILTWYVDPNRGDVGFSPHRDRQPDDSPCTFRPDGSAMYATCWIPFTDACPENSCLYVIPRWADPGYFVGDSDEVDSPSPLQLALPDKEAYQNIRACPAPAGSAVIFTHRTIHWGSKGRKGYHTPRVSMSFGCADDAYEPPYFSREHLPFPPFRLRVALACAQMLIYHERFPVSAKMLSLFHHAFKQEAREFDPEYRRKVLAEFVAASKLVLMANPAVNPNASASGARDARGTAHANEITSQNANANANAMASASPNANVSASARLNENDAEKVDVRATGIVKRKEKRKRVALANDGMEPGQDGRQKTVKKRKHVDSDGGVARADQEAVGVESDEKGDDRGNGPNNLLKRKQTSGGKTEDSGSGQSGKQGRKGKRNKDEEEVCCEEESLKERSRAGKKDKGKEVKVIVKVKEGVADGVATEKSSVKEGKKKKGKKVMEDVNASGSEEGGKKVRVDATSAKEIKESSNTLTKAMGAKKNDAKKGKQEGSNGNGIELAGALLMEKCNGDDDEDSCGEDVGTGWDFAAGLQNAGTGSGSDSEDMLEDALEAMLDAEIDAGAGRGLFQDDYDGVAGMEDDDE